jgi:FtsZ-binding cell division protein ZapB
LEKYGHIKEVIEGLSKEVIIITNQIDHLRMEMSALKEKTRIMQLKIIKIRKVMKLLSKEVAKVARAFNLPSSIFSTETLMAILSNMNVYQKLEEKKKKELENTASTNKITRYNSNGKAVEIAWYSPSSSEVSILS